MPVNSPSRGTKAPFRLLFGLEAPCGRQGRGEAGAGGGVEAVEPGRTPRGSGSTIYSPASLAQDAVAGAQNDISETQNQWLRLRELDMRASSRSDYTQLKHSVEST